MSEEKIVQSEKSRLVALLLCVFLGWLGLHRFYVGKGGSGFVMVLLSLSGFLGWACAIWVVADLIMICTGDFEDKEGRPVLDWNFNTK